MSLIIVHSAAEGTLVWGTSRGDGSAEILKTQQWRWGRDLGAWYLPRTRDQRPNRARIEQTAQALRAAGFTVQLDIDDRTRPAAAVEADRITRQQQRTTHLQEQADRAAAAARQAWNAADAAAGKLPPMGEPIKIGHHSEQRHRRAAQRAQAALTAALDAHHQAEEAQHRAETATHTTGARYNPTTVANRIDTLEADARALQRHLDGHTHTHHRHPVTGQSIGDTAAPATGGRREQLTDQHAQINDQLAYWRQVRADQIATGEATPHSRSTIHPGDLVQVSRRWYRVIRANPKTVSVATNTGRRTTPYSHITNHQPNPDGLRQQGRDRMLMEPHRTSHLQAYQDASRLDAMREEAIASIRATQDYETVRESRAQARRSGVRAMVSTRADQLATLVQAHGYTDPRQAVEQTRALSVRDAAAATGLSKTTIRRRRNAADPFDVGGLTDQDRA